MLRSTLRLAACAALACAPSPFPEDDTASESSGDAAPLNFPGVIEDEVSFVDPIRVSPDRYRVLEVAPRVRVLVAEWPPSTSDKPHSHPTTIWYALTDANLQIKTGNSRLPLGRAISSGASGVQAPVVLHSIRNTGDAAAAILMFEIAPRSPVSSAARVHSAPKATAVSNHFQLLEKHEGFRLLLLSIEPNRRIRLHSHPATIWFALDRSHLRFSQTGSEPFELHLEGGEVKSRPAVAGHTAINIGDAIARFLLLEADD